MADKKVSQVPRAVRDSKGGEGKEEKGGREE